MTDTSDRRSVKFNIFFNVVFPFSVSPYKLLCDNNYEIEFDDCHFWWNDMPHFTPFRDIFTDGVIDCCAN